MIQQCIAELDHLVYPNSARGRRSEDEARVHDYQGAIWINFAVTIGMIAFIALIVSTDGLDPPAALLASVSSVSNIGPAYELTTLSTGHAPVSYADLSSTSKVVLGLGMVFGRFEILALLTLFNLAYWRS